MTGERLAALRMIELTDRAMTALERGEDRAAPDAAHRFDFYRDVLQTLRDAAGLMRHETPPREGAAEDVLPRDIESVRAVLAERVGALGGEAVS